MGATMTMIGNITVIGSAAKFSVAFPLLYHYLGGVRHLVWDHMPEQTLDNEKVEQSSYLLFGVSTTLSALLAFA